MMEVFGVEWTRNTTVGIKGVNQAVIYSQMSLKMGDTYCICDQGWLAQGIGLVGVLSTGHHPASKR